MRHSNVRFSNMHVPHCVYIWQKQDLRRFKGQEDSIHPLYGNLGGDQEMDIFEWPRVWIGH